MNQPACDKYSDIVVQNESFSFSFKEREELNIEICSDSEPPLDLSLSSNTSDIGTTHCVPTKDSRLPGYAIALIIISIVIIIIAIIIAMIIIYIWYKHAIGTFIIYTSM